MFSRSRAEIPRPVGGVPLRIDIDDQHALTSSASAAPRIGLPWSSFRPHPSGWWIARIRGGGGEAGRAPEGSGMAARFSSLRRTASGSGERWESSSTIPICQGPCRANVKLLGMAGTLSGTGPAYRGRATLRCAEVRVDPRVRRREARPSARALDKSRGIRGLRVLVSRRVKTATLHPITARRGLPAGGPLFRRSDSPKGYPKARARVSSSESKSAKKRRPRGNPPPLPRSIPAAFGAVRGA